MGHTKNWILVLNLGGLMEARQNPSAGRGEGVGGLPLPMAAIDWLFKEILLGALSANWS